MKEACLVCTGQELAFEKPLPQQALIGNLGEAKLSLDVEAEFPLSPLEVVLPGQGWGMVVGKVEASTAAAQAVPVL